MKKTLMISILTFILIASASISAATTSENNIYNTSNERNYYALVIGIEEFVELESPDEEYLDESATAFYEKLVSSKNWNEENIRFLLNEQATKDNIHDSIVNWLDEREDEDDIVLIYIASHGWKIPLKQRKYGHAFVFSYDAKDHSFDETKISDKEYDSWLDKLDSKHITIIHDQCYSGRMFAIRQYGRTYLAAGGKYLFCPANWSAQLESLIFTYYLLEGFDGVADINDDGWITAREVFNYARYATIWHSTWHHFPYIWETAFGLFFVGPQIPYMYDRHMGNMPLIQYR